MQTQMEIALEVLEGLFAESQRIAIKDAVAAAAKRGVSRTTLTRARKKLGAVEIHNGPYGGFWEWDREDHPDYEKEER